MNRGNLAEDPRVDRPSQSRYSRYDSGRNALLYESDREWNKSISHRSGKNRAAKDHSEKKQSVSAKTVESYSKLEVGLHGRLFGVQVNPGKETVKTDFGSGKNTADTKTMDLQQAKIDRAEAAFRTIKPARPYLDAPNPLLESKNIHAANNRAGRRKAAAEEKHALRRERKAAAAQIRRAESVSIPHPEKAAAFAGTQVSAATARKASPRKAVVPSVDPGASQMGRAALAAQTAVAETPAPAAAAAPSAASSEVPAAAAQSAKTLSSKKMLIAAGAGLLAALYIGAGVHFSDHFYPSTSFFGIEADGKTVEEVKKLVADRVADYSLTLKGRAGSEDSSGITDVITAGDAGLRYRDNGMIDRHMKQQYSAVWPVMLIRSLIVENHETLGTTYDPDKVEELMKNLSIFDKSRVTAPKNAELRFSQDGAYISKEVMGTTLNRKKTKKAIYQALNDGCTSVDLNKEGLYKNPTVFSDDDALNEKANALNKVLGANVTLEFGSRSEKLDPETITDRFLSLDMDGNYYIDEDKVTDYVTNLAAATDTVGMERSFDTSLGTTVELQGGDYGWTLDADTTSADLISALEMREKGELEPTYFQTAMSREENDIGDSYVEIDLTNQHMWFYHDGDLIVDTPVVTGNPQKGNETPYGGVWSLKGKYRHATLKGQGYATPVDYWMPFNGGVGIHDLQARYYFGGSVYNGAGSHGCVNTPLAAVKLIYHYIDNGTPVIVYKDDSETAVSQNTGMQDIGTITAQIEAKYGTVSDPDNSASGSGETFETDQGGTT